MGTLDEGTLTRFGPPRLFGLDFSSSWACRTQICCEGPHTDFRIGACIDLRNVKALSGSLFRQCGGGSVSSAKIRDVKSWRLADSEGKLKHSAGFPGVSDEERG